MTRAEAEDRAATLNREHPERGAYRWMARAADEDWQVVRVAIPGGVGLGSLHGVVETRTRPEAPDPRTTFEKNVGGPWIPGV
jgi:hypothetical protein